MLNFCLERGGDANHKKPLADPRKGERVIIYRKTQFTIPNIVCKERLVNNP